MRKIELFAVCIALGSLLLFGPSKAKATPPQEQQAFSGNCLTISVAPYEDTNIPNFVVNNNCGQSVVVVFATPVPGPIGGDGAQMFTLDSGSSAPTQIQTSWSYKYWGCYNGRTPTDPNTGQKANYNSDLNSIVCR